MKIWTRADYQMDEKRREKRHAFRMELIMVIATVFSAFATVGAVAVGVFQYRAAEEALVADNRNGAFQDFAEAVTPMCEVLDTTVIEVLITELTKSALLSGSSVESTARAWSQEAATQILRGMYSTYGKSVSDQLTPLSKDYRVKARRFKIWAGSGSEDMFRRMNAFMRLMGKFEQQATWIPGTGTMLERQQRAWAANVLSATKACVMLPDGLISWYRDSVPLVIDIPAD